MGRYVQRAQFLTGKGAGRANTLPLRLQPQLSSPALQAFLRLVLARVQTVFGTYRFHPEQA